LANGRLELVEKERERGGDRRERGERGERR